jgi:tetratricopeptide (TPR) repeat protein
MLDQLDNLRAILEADRTEIARLEDLAGACPDDGKLQEHLAYKHQRRAEGLQQLGEMTRDDAQLRAALEHHRAALAIRKRLVLVEPGNAHWQRNLLLTHKGIADVLAARGDWAAAVERYRVALLIAEALAQSAPRHGRPQLDLYFVHTGMALAEAQLGESDRALTSLRAARAIIVRLHEALPDDHDWPIYLAWIDGEIAKLGA